MKAAATRTGRVSKFCKGFLAALFAFGCAMLAVPQPAHAQGNTIMVIAPHPDDEALCCSGVIYSALQAGKNVVVVIVTNGDDYTTPASKSAGLTREGESVAAMQTLGLNTSNVVFLGYGDQTLQELLFSTSATQVYTSPANQTKTYGNNGLGGESYHQYLTGSAGSYNQQTILSDFESVLKNFAPTDIYTTGMWDDHPDHRATYAFTSQALIALKKQGLLTTTRIHETWIHAYCEDCDENYTWPEPVFTPTTPFPEPEFISMTPYDWTQIESIPVPAAMQDTSESANLKFQTIYNYHSQTEDDLSSYLFGFIKINEFFWVRNFETNVGPLATATASSQSSSVLNGAANAIDGIISGQPNPVDNSFDYISASFSGGGEWVSNNQLSGAWIKLTWPSSVTTSKVILYGRPDGTDNVLSGTLTFSDGSSVPVGALPVGGAGLPITFASKTITSMTFTVNSAQGSAIGLAEIEVFGTLTSSTTAFNPQMTDGPTPVNSSTTPDAPVAMATSAFDVFGYPLTYTWTANGGTFSGSGTSVTYDPPGVPGIYTETVTVTDGHGGSTLNNTFVTVSCGLCGTITGPGGPGATVTITGGSSVTASAAGVFSFDTLSNGNYTVTPSLPGYSFNPSSQSVTVSGGNATANFTSAPLLYSLSGTINGVAGATVTLTSGGSTVSTLTSGSSGSTFAFANLPNGTSYTVTPSLSGYTFAPTSASVTINAGNATVPAFTATLIPTYSISGTVTGVTGATLTLTQSGSTVATTTSNGSGTYSFTNVPNGNYTVTPSLSPYSFTPSSASITVSGANVVNVNFNGSAAQSLFTTQTPALTGKSDGSNTNYELGTLFQANVAGQINGVRFWKDANESGTHTGHIWSSSGTLLATVTFTNETASGWQVQNLSTPLSISANTSYMVSVNTGNTYYVDTFGGLLSQITNQNLSSVVTTNNGAFGSVGTFPNSSYQNSNYFRDIVFVPATAATYSISGTVNGVAGATMTLTSGGTTVATLTTGASGSTYTFNNVSNGNYTVTPTLSGYTFSPSGASVTVSGGNANVAAFTATAATYTISGTVNGVAGATVTLTSGGSTIATLTTGASGSTYTFNNVANGSYTVTPSLSGYSFAPTSASVTVNNGNASVSAFTATALTYSISGTINGASGATVTLTSGGSTVATLTSGASGSTYTFTNIANGAYTVTPTLSGYSFSPTSASVTVSNGNASVAAFTASTGQSYSISGSTTVAGVTVTLASGGSTVATTTSGTAGAYSFTNVPNGNYTVTPSFTTYNFSPTNSPVTVSGASMAGINFTPTESVFTTQTPVLTGKSDGSSTNYELGMLFQSDIAGQITAVRFWKDANESGTHTGHVWSSTGTLLATVTFTNETASGWQQQNLTTPLSVTANTSYMVSVNTGNTSYVDTFGGLASKITNLDMSSVVTTNNGAYGTVGTFPNSSYDNSNYFRDVVFVPGTPATYSVSGTVNGVAGATVTLTSGSATVATLTTGASGSTYTFTSIPNGTYTVTPTLSGYSFSPTSASVTVNNGNASAAAFTATAVTYTISGTVNGVAGATITLTSGGSTVATLTTGASGSTYTFNNVANGAYTVTPTLSGYTFSPTSASVTVNNANASVSAFTATAVTYTISGTVNGVAGATVTLTSGSSTVATLTTGSSGSTYTFNNVANGSYTVTPSLSGYSFAPTSASVTVNNGNASVSAFTATALTYSISGTINGASGATVTLTSGGSTVATLTSGASGSTYTFTNIANGAYTVTPTLSGYSFSPTSASVTVNNGNASVAAFTASTGQSYSISGSTTVAGVTVTLASGGSTVATTTSGTAGAYSFTNVPNGNYTVTPSLTTYNFLPANSSVTVNGGNVASVNFTSTESVFTTQTPVLTGKSDGSGVNFELGMLFQSDTAGQITAVRFWKDANESGTHTGHVWSSTGTLLATVTFTNETASGWQQQNLTTPLSVTANTSYMVSVNTGNTYYVDTFGGLASKITNLDMSSVVTTNNGAYGTVGTFPNSSYDNSNYFRDVVFVP